MKKHNIAFEISDAHEHHAHIIPIIYAFSRDLTFHITLYSIDQKHIDAFNDLYFKVYSEQCCLNINIIVPGLTHRLKHGLISFLKPIKLISVVKALRFVYGSIRGNNTVLEGGNDFYLKSINFFKLQQIIFTTELKGGSALRKLNIKIVFCLHGIISNDNPFFKDWSCDLVVSPSIGLASKLRSLSNFPKEALVYQYAYLKKEVINKLVKNELGLGLFQNKKYTFLYNPHWDNSQGQSSWEEYGDKILNYFYNNSEYNLIFAPHILIDKYFGIKLDKKYFQATNIHIDINTPKLCNGFYIPFTDCYIGDVSSQYFEFLLYNKDIKSVFINTSHMNWLTSGNYDYWKNGKVVNNYLELETFFNSLEEHKYSANSEEAYQALFANIPENQDMILKNFIIDNFM